MSRAEIVGVRSLDRKLRKLPGLVDEAGRKSVRDEVEETADDMRRTAPRDTGELVEGIREEIDPGGLSGAAASTARHSTFVNDGTRDTPAQPFATTAGVHARRRFPKRLTADLNDALRKAGKL